MSVQYKLQCKQQEPMQHSIQLHSCTACMKSKFTHQLMECGQIFQMAEDMKKLPAKQKNTKKFIFQAPH